MDNLSEKKQIDQIVAHLSVLNTLDKIMEGLRVMAKSEAAKRALQEGSVPEKTARIVDARREAMREEFEIMLVKFGKLNYDDQLFVMQVVRRLASTPQSEALWRYFLDPTVKDNVKLKPISLTENILYLLEREKDPSLPEREIVAIPAGALELLEL